VQVFSHTPSLVRAKDSGFVAQASARGFFREQGKTQQPEEAAEKVLFCHPERSEGSAFLRQTQEKADSSGKPSPSE
jgi:hypothetical protein